MESLLKPYWKMRGSLTLCDKLLLYSSRILVPSSLRRENMLKIHEGHQGVERCKSRLRTSVRWPGAASQVQQFVKNCRECAEETCQWREPLLPTPLPDYLWQMVATYLFELKGDHYLLAVDYFSQYPEVYKRDNGPQYASKEFSKLAKSYRFNHLTSSLTFPQSNGQVERMVQTIKSLLKHSVDIHLALLSYRATPMPWCGLGPSELCLGRRIKTTIPLVMKQLIPS